MAWDSSYNKITPDVCSKPFQTPRSPLSHYLDASSLQGQLLSTLASGLVGKACRCILAALPQLASRKQSPMIG
jgi:hypothetical protein